MKCESNYIGMFTGQKFFMGRHLKVTPMDEYGPCRFEGKVVNVDMVDNLFMLTIMLFRPHDVRWRNEETVYFSPDKKKWSLCVNMSTNTMLMVEVSGFSFLEHKREYVEYGLFISGDDVRRLIKNKFNYCFVVTRKDCSKNYLDPDHNKVNVIDLHKGLPLLMFVEQILNKWPTDVFEQDEIKMLRTYLSYYGH